MFTDTEVEGLFAIMRKLTSEGKSIIFISHKMREVLHISDRITILRLGEVIDTVNRDQVDGQKLADMMIGRELKPSHYEKKVVPHDPVVELANVEYNKTNKHNGLGGGSLAVNKGEIVGIAGVDGNGQTQLAQLIAGVIRPDAGHVSLRGKEVQIFDPNDFINEGVSHIPEDRNLQGLVGDMSIADNLVLKKTEDPQFASGIFLKQRVINQYAKEMIQKYDIRCQGFDQDVRSLSGGNQQKVILARELESHPDLLIAVHPTRGLDIGAADFVHEQMIKARAENVCSQR